MSVELFKGPLTGTFQPSRAFLLPGLDVVFEWVIESSGGPTALEWYLEFGPSLTDFFREVAEEDAGAGVVSMPKVVRTFADNAGTTLADGTHRIDTEFRRKNQFARVQMRVASGAAQVTLVAPFGKG